MEQSSIAAQQFGATARAYLESAVHAKGADLDRLTALARDMNQPQALDLGCGAGHAGFALASGGARVTAYDLTAEMLSVVEEEARRRGLHTIRTRQGPAERMPFADAAFDLVVTRYSAHHWIDLPAALREAARVLKPNGVLVVIDVLAPESPLLDTILQAIEILRDLSHVRDYRRSEWQAMLQAAGFGPPVSDCWTVPLEFTVWTERMRTPELRVQAIRDILAHSAAEARQHFQVKEDGSFSLDVGWMQTWTAGRD